LALFAFLVEINSQSIQVVLCTYYDSACSRVSECSQETTNSCTTLLGSVSMFISYTANNGSGVVSSYTQSSCAGTATNTSYTVNNCAMVGTGGTSLQVFTGATVWSSTTLYSGQPATCSGSGVAFSGFTLNLTGYSCTPTNCTVGPFSASQVSCGVSVPSCPFSSGYTFAATYNQPGCPISSTQSIGCNVLSTCIPFPPNAGNASSMSTCNNGVPGGTSWVGPGCVGNTTNPGPVNGTLVGTCVPTGISPGYETVSCTSAPTTTGTTTASTTGSTSATTSAGSIISVSVLSILSMIVLSLLI